MFFIDRNGAAKDESFPLAPASHWYSKLKTSQPTVISNGLENIELKDVQPKLIRSLSLKGPSISFMFGCPDTNFLVTCDFSKNVAIYSNDASSISLVCSFRLPAISKVKGVYVPVTNEVLLYGDRAFFYLFDLSTKRLKTFKLKCEKSCKIKSICEYSSKLLAITFEDMPRLSIIDARTKIEVSEINFNANIRVAASFRDCLYVSTEDRNVYTVRSSTIISKVSQPDLCTFIYGDQGRGYVLLGYISGYVSLYLPSDLKFSSPVKTLSNLTTAIDCITGNTKLALYASKDKRNAVRLVDLSRLEVIRKWPHQNDPLGHVVGSTFMQNMMILCSQKGSIYVYEL